MKMERDLQEPDLIQVQLDHQQDRIEDYPKWHVKWSMLKDPVGVGLSKVLEATVEHVRTTMKELKRLMKTIRGYMVLSVELSKQMDREENAYQKVFLNSICGHGKMLNVSNQLLDAIQDMGKSHREHKWEIHHKINAVTTSGEDHPWDKIIQRTRLLEQEVPTCYQSEAAMKEMYLPEEEVLQTTTCSTKDIHQDIEGWRKAFTKELDSLDRQNVKTDVWENALV